MRFVPWEPNRRYIHNLWSSTLLVSWNSFYSIFVSLKFFFCRHCILEQLKFKNECPICREPLTSSSVIFLQNYYWRSCCVVIDKLLQGINSNLQETLFAWKASTSTQTLHHVFRESFAIFFFNYCNHCFSNFETYISPTLKVFLLLLRTRVR
jgi:hypothetical protein